MRSFALVLTATAIFLPSCCSNSTPVFPSLTGYNFSLPFPRGDIKPGTVLVRWKDGTVLPLCQPGVDFGGNGETPGPSVQLDSSEQAKLKADLSVKVTGIVNAQLGVNSAKDITSTVTANDRSEKAPLVDARQVLGTVDCQKNAQLMAAGHPDIKFISLVTQVAETTIDYTVTLNSGVNVAAGTESDLATKVGFGGTATFENGTDKKLQVTGARLVIHYNSDDGLLASLLPAH